MYDVEDLSDSSTFSTIKDCKDLFNTSKRDSQEDSDSTIIIEENDTDKSPVAIRTVSSSWASSSSTQDSTIYPSTSKMTYFDDKFKLLDKPTSNYNKDNNLYFPSHKVDPELEAILLKYTSPPLDTPGTTLRSCEVKTIVTGDSDACELIELSSDEDENIGIINANKPCSISAENKNGKCSRADSTESLHNSYTVFEENPFKINNKVGSSPLKTDVMDVDYERLSNKYKQMSDEDDFSWTDIKYKESSFKTTEMDHEDIVNKYKTPVNTETNYVNKLEKGDDPTLCKSPKRKRKLNSEKENKKESRANLQAKKREEAEKAKKIKQTLVAANKNLKPEECMKFVTVRLDSEIANSNYAGDVLNGLQSADITYRIESQLIPFTISWNRKTEKHFMDEQQELITTTNTIEENEILLILQWKEIVELVQNRSLVKHVKSLQSILVDKKLVLAIYGMENYFKYQKSKKQKTIRTEITGTTQKTNNKYDKTYKDAAIINMKQLEFAVTELQLLCGCCHRMVENSQDLGSMIVQFTKSIAQAPYKLEKLRKAQEEEWYISGDNKDTVQVDKNGNGLQRLWQQQLTTFPLARLEHAEAIVAKYSTPTSLIEEYSRCTQAEGEKLLQDIPIRRAAGPFTTVRKIGPELSKKIFKYFTSTDGNVVL